MVILWRELILLKSEMPWEISMVSVVNIISSISKLIWIIKSIKLVSRSLDVVLNTITVKIINSSLTIKVFLGLKLEERNILSGHLNDNPVIVFAIIMNGVWVNPLIILIISILSSKN